MVSDSRVSTRTDISPFPGQPSKGLQLVVATFSLGSFINQLSFLFSFLLIPAWFQAYPELKCPPWELHLLSQAFGGSHISVDVKAASSQIIEFQTAREQLPRGPVGKNPSSQCRGPGFDPWSGSQMPYALTKSPHAAIKDPTHHNKDRRCPACHNWDLA